MCCQSQNKKRKRGYQSYIINFKFDECRQCENEQYLHDYFQAFQPLSKQLTNLKIFVFENNEIYSNLAVLSINALFISQNIQIFILFIFDKNYFKSNCMKFLSIASFVALAGSASCLQADHQFLSLDNLNPQALPALMRGDWKSMLPDELKTIVNAAQSFGILNNQPAQPNPANFQNLPGVAALFSNNQPAQPDAYYQPAQPAQPNQPYSYSQPTQPTQPTQPAQPNYYSEPTQPGLPQPYYSQPSQPSQPGLPAPIPVQAVSPSQPARTGIPVTQPSDDTDYDDTVQAESPDDYEQEHKFRLTNHLNRHRIQ